ncbi:MAG TPA: hypothetical protein VFS43_31560 [Polyangiaceae bacterium]|nr:hypothetical protein [Polyangiaceae bacterium]
MRRFWLPFTYLALVSSLTLVGCGDDDDDPGTTNGTGGRAGTGGTGGRAGTGGSGTGGSGTGGTAGSGTGGSGTGGSAGSGTGGSAGDGTGGSAGDGTGGSAGDGTGGSAGDGTGGSGTGGSGTGGSGTGGSGTGGSGTGGSGTGGSGTGGSGTGGSGTGGSGTGGSGTGGSGTGGSGTGGSGTGGSGTGGSGTGGSGTGGSGTGGSGTGGSGTGGSGTGGSGTGGSGTGGSGTGGSGTGGSGTGGSGTGGSGGGGSGPIVINELAYNSKGTPDAGCYIELKGPPGASLANHSLRSINGNGGTLIAEFKFSSGQALDANGYFVIAQDNTVTVPAGGAIVVSTFADLQNGPDSLVLVNNATSATLDAVGYSDALGAFNSPNIFQGEGKFAIAPTTPQVDLGFALSRLPDGGDTNDNFTDFGIGARTPGAANVAVPTVVGFCNVQFPATLCSTPGTPSATVYGQVYVGGLTDASGTPAPGIKSELGFGPAGSDPRVSTNWVYTAATINPGFDFNQNNDEYQASLPGQANPGTLSYVYRVSLNGGPFLYCDTTGTTDDPNNLPFTPADLGTWTVAASCP